MIIHVIMHRSLNYKEIKVFRKLNNNYLQHNMLQLALEHAYCILIQIFLL